MKNYTTKVQQNTQVVRANEQIIEQMQEIKEYMKENEEKVSAIEKGKEKWLQEKQTLAGLRDQDKQEVARLKSLLTQYQRDYER